MDRYRVVFRTEVVLTINDPTVLSRVLDDEDGWKSDFYDLDEAGVVEMLARNIGIDGCRIGGMDGWANTTKEAATAYIDHEEVESWEKMR